MNLLEFSIQTSEKLNSINDSTFATIFVEAKSHCFHTYQNNIVTSNSHGLNFFDNVIKFWDNPDAYYTPLDKKGNPIDTTKKEVAKDDYEYNFIRILKMNKEKYICVMFPYPSGDGLHVGHAYNYAIVDSYCRWQTYKRMDVLQPFGFDAFGLPAENYARKHNRDPREVTYENIDKFRIQMEKMNTNYKELLVTSDESYYKWTQWLFTKLYKKGLAYKKMGPVNHCPSCETVLANEQVKDGTCDRCSSIVEIKEMNQWYFKITDYKERLIKNLETLDYPEKTKKQQLHWLENLNDWCVSRQRKWGCPIPIEGEEDTLDTFVDSSFYYLRYLDPTNENELFAKEKYKQVDLYIGGNEHATSHLVYSRFINMFLYDIGVVSEEEPFRCVRHQGMITYKGEKMSKSRGNVVNPDAYNPGHLRMYLMFIAHYFDGGSWSDENFKGIERFDSRIKLWISKASDDGINIELEDFIKKMDSNFEAFKVNKVISDWMIFYNQNKNKVISKKSAHQIMELYNIINPGSF